MSSTAGNKLTADQIAEKAEELKDKHEEIIDLMVEAAQGMRQHDEALLKICSKVYELLGLADGDGTDPDADAVADKIIDSIEYC